MRPSSLGRHRRYVARVSSVLPVFYDCSAESPKGRRSVCYDREALEARKEHKPKNSATDMAAAMGIEMLTEAQYRELQTLGEFDTTTSSLVKTPSDIRSTRRRYLLRSPLRPRLHVSQRCGVLLCRSGVPWRAESLRVHGEIKNLELRISNAGHEFQIPTSQFLILQRALRSHPRQTPVDRRVERICVEGRRGWSALLQQGQST